MLSDAEQQAVDLGRQIVDAALAQVGKPSLAVNPGVREGEAVRWAASGV